MNYRDQLKRAGIPGLLLAATLVLAGSMHLGAQSFERTFGRSDDEVGRAILQTADGGYIATGYTTDSKNRQLAYVTRMGPMGSTIWERRFGVGNAEQTSGMDIRQLANGDHVLVGTITFGQPGCSAGCAHIYAIRFSDNGDLIWYRSYGDNNSNQYATSVVETLVPNPGIDDVGNLVIAGYSTDQTGEHKGVLMRIWSNGDLRWARQYDADPTLGNVNELMSVDEARIGAGAGDIVAAGSTTFSVTKQDVWVLRVDGITGNVVAAPQGSAGFSTRRDDAGYSIQELRLGANPGDLVIAGTSPGKIVSTNNEILMLQTRPNPCDQAGQRGDQFLGDGGSDMNIAMCVREITDSDLGQIGDVIVTGTTYTSSYEDDIFLQQFAEQTMAPVGNHMLYGGHKDEGGYGVAIAQAIAGPGGFIATGFAFSSPPTPSGHASDLYVVHTDIFMNSCTAHSTPVISEVAELRMKCTDLDILSPAWTVLCSGDSYGPDWGTILCQ